MCHATGSGKHATGWLSHAQFDSLPAICLTKSQTSRTVSCRGEVGEPARRFLLGASARLSSTPVRACTPGHVACARRGRVSRCETAALGAVSSLSHVHPPLTNFALSRSARAASA
eukprot:6202923-Pleurochrysis_carterae.AAC.6